MAFELFSRGVKIGCKLAKGARGTQPLQAVAVSGRASELCAGSRQLRDGSHRFGIHDGIIAPIGFASERG